MHPIPRLRGALAAFCLGAVTLLGSSTAQAQDPTFAYQGYLDRDGVPVDGVYDFWVYLYADTADASSVPATGAIWNESHLDVKVRQGHFAFLIGPVPSARLVRRPLWVRVAVKKDSDPDGDPQYWTYLIGLQQLTASLDASTGVPPGSLMPFAGTTVPEGWLPCDGSPLRSADYPRLHAAIGTRWGNGASGTCATGGCNFNLPDLRGRFLRGDPASTARDPGPRNRCLTGGSTSGVGSCQDEDTLSHDHGVGSLALSTNGAHTHTYTDPNTGGFKGLAYDGTGTTAEYSSEGAAGVTSSEGSHSHTIGGATASAGGNETRPENAIVLYIIKY